MQKGQEQADNVALQGTGRMALYAGLHPAQLKDSVTSTLRSPSAAISTHLQTGATLVERIS